MAVGKNKLNKKGGKKGGKKKVVDPFIKKDWYGNKAPAMFTHQQVGKTLVTRSSGNKFAADGLKGRVYDVNQGELHGEGDTYRKFKLICEDVQGKNCILNFHGMSLTRDKMCSMVKKWHTMIEAHIDVKTTDGYQLRVFVVAFTKRHRDTKTQQVKKTTYAQTQQVKMIRKKMTEIVTSEIQNCDIRSLVEKLLPDSIAKDIEVATRIIYPIHDVHISKVKVVKKPKIDISKLMELHGEAGVSVNKKGEKVERGDNYEPPVVQEV